MLNTGNFDIKLLFNYNFKIGNLVKFFTDKPNSSIETILFYSNTNISSFNSLLLLLI